jgi:hypothetical protein
MWAMGRKSSTAASKLPRSIGLAQSLDGRADLRSGDIGGHAQDRHGQVASEMGGDATDARPEQPGAALALESVATDRDHDDAGLGGDDPGDGLDGQARLDEERWRGAAQVPTRWATSARVRSASWRTSSAMRS